jgi:hypothetical protein
MEINFFSIITLIMLAAWIIQALRVALTQKKFTRKSILNFLASACLIIGAVGVFGSDLIATAGIDLPKSFEWPVGSTNNAIKLPDGTIVVPLEQTARIQVYEPSLEFQRGWHIDAGGGVFKLVPDSGDSFYIYTFKNSMKYLYDTSGSLLSSEEYSESYAEVNSQTINVSIPTPFYLWIFTNSVFSWIVGLIGLLLLIVTGEAISKKA